MKRLFYRFGLLSVLLPLFLGACSKSDIDELKANQKELAQRVATLEEMAKTANTNIGTLQGLVTALEGNDYITSVDPKMENGLEVGQTITFAKKGEVVIYHGKKGDKGDKGDRPVIGVKESDGKYYWTIDGEWLLDDQDRKICATGSDAEAPQVRINTETKEWEISTDGGKTWKATGIAATGEGIFAPDGVDTTSSPGNVIFTLADGTTFTLPVSPAVTVGFDSFETFFVTPVSKEIPIILPAALRESDYTSLIAQVSSKAGTDMDIHTRGVQSPWKVVLTGPTFTDGVCGNDAKVIVTANGASSGDQAVLKVTIVDNRGREISSTRILEYFDGTVVQMPHTGGLSAALADTDPAGITSIKITGKLANDDFQYIRANLTALETLDISGTDLTVLPNKALAFYNNANSTLKEVILPEGLTTIGNSAFAMCKALERVNIPSTVTSLGRWMLEGCTKVTSVTIPQGVTEIPASCFFRSGLTSIEIPENVETIGGWAFEECPIAQLTIPSTVKSIGTGAFGCYDYFTDNSLAQLQSVTIGNGITEIPDFCFIYHKKLQTVSISEGVTRIGTEAFNQCKISSLTLPQSLEEIGPTAFSNNGITQITIPNKVKIIGCSAFSGNHIAIIDLPASIQSLHAAAFHWESNALTTVICRAAAVPAMPTEYTTDLGTNTYAPFIRMKKENVTLKVPAESLEAYRTAWGNYFSSVEAIQ